MMKDLIRQELIKKGLTQKELAKIISVTPQAVSEWIKGTKQPSWDNVVLMAKVFGESFGQKAMKKGIRSKTTMKKEHNDLKDLDSIKKANEEAELLLNEINANDYSHATYVLLKWFVPAVIGLAYHKFINNKDKEAEFYYDDIFYYMNNYFEECDSYPNEYPNELEYNFFLLGGDVFESFEPYKLPNDEYARDSMDLWYRFKKALENDRDSNLANEFRVALTELISENSYY